MTFRAWATGWPRSARLPDRPIHNRKFQHSVKRAQALDCVKSIDQRDQKKFGLMPKGKCLGDAGRSLSGFEFSGLWDNTACFTINSPPGGQNAKWDSALCHGANMGNVAFCERSVQQLNNSRLLTAITAIDSKETIDGNS